MLNFFLFTLVFWAFAACVSWLLYYSIQQGQWLDRIFDWQKMLHGLYMRGGGWALLAKPLGDCLLCFTHSITFFSFWFYPFFSRLILGFWFTDMYEGRDVDDLAAWAIRTALNIGWFIVYDSIGTTGGYFLTKKLMKR